MRTFPFAALAFALGCTGPRFQVGLAPAYFPDTTTVFYADYIANALHNLDLAPLTRSISDTSSVYRTTSFMFQGTPAVVYTIRPRGDSASVELRYLDAHQHMHVVRGQLSSASWAQLAEYEKDWQIWTRQGRGAEFNGLDGGGTLLESVVGGEYRAWSTQVSDRDLDLYHTWLAYQLDLALGRR